MSRILMPRSLEPNIVWRGDSRVWGSQTADPGGTTSSPYFLAQALGLKYEIAVFNHGVPGLGSTDLEDVDQLLRNDRPNILIDQIGINDIYAGVPAVHRP